MTEYGVTVTMKLLRTAEKFQIIRQFKLLDQILGPSNIFIRIIKRLIGLPIIKLMLTLLQSHFLQLVPLQKTELAKNMLVCHIKWIQKKLRNVLTFNGLHYSGLRSQHKVFIAPVDKRQHLRYLICSQLTRQVPETGSLKI